MFVRNSISFGTLLLVYILLSASIETNAAIQSWANYREPIGGEGTELYLQDKVQVTYAVGEGYSSHFIQGKAYLVKNRVDNYCYVKVDSEWYVHLAG